MSNNFKNTSPFQHNIERTIKMKLYDKAVKLRLGLGFLVGVQVVSTFYAERVEGNHRLLETYPARKGVTAF